MWISSQCWFTGGYKWSCSCPIKNTENPWVIGVTTPYKSNFITGATYRLDRLGLGKYVAEVRSVGSRWTPVHFGSEYSTMYQLLPVVTLWSPTEKVTKKKQKGHSEEPLVRFFLHSRWLPNLWTMNSRVSCLNYLVVTFCFQIFRMLGKFYTHTQ